MSLDDRLPVDLSLSELRCVLVCLAVILNGPMEGWHDAEKADLNAAWYRIDRAYASALALSRRVAR